MDQTLFKGLKSVEKQKGLFGFLIHPPLRYAWPCNPQGLPASPVSPPMAVSSYLTFSPLGGGSKQAKRILLVLKAYKSVVYKLLIHPPVWFLWHFP
jgi:hypothetical protein